MMQRSLIACLISLVILGASGHSQGGDRSAEAHSGQKGSAMALSGTVKGPDAAPYERAFVRAQNSETKITFYVLSDKAGHYRVDNLPVGNYRVQAVAPGFRADVKDASVAAGHATTLDLAMDKNPVRWSDISIYQAKRLWPDDPGKKLIFDHCFV
jgi:hypothetical protein